MLMNSAHSTQAFEKKTFFKKTRRTLLGLLVVTISSFFTFHAFADSYTSPESYLLHKQLKPEYFYRIHVKKDGISLDSDPERRTDFSQHEFMFYHFWDLDCKPCMDELPAIKELMAILKKYNIHPVYVIETIETNRIEAFYKKNPTLFFEGADHYHSSNSGTRRILGTDVKPLSFLTDKRNIIRQAFVGAVQWHARAVEEHAKRFVDAAKAGSTHSSSHDSNKKPKSPTQ